jgi:hypothetical protein
VKQQVFQLEVSMDDVVVMHELDGKAHLSDDVAHPLLMQSSLLLQTLIDVPTTANLHH